MSIYWSNSTQSNHHVDNYRPAPIQRAVNRMWSRISTKIGFNIMMLMSTKRETSLSIKLGIGFDFLLCLFCYTTFGHPVVASFCSKFSRSLHSLNNVEHYFFSHFRFYESHFPSKRWWSVSLCSFLSLCTCVIFNNLLYIGKSEGLPANVGMIYRVILDAVRGWVRSLLTMSSMVSVSKEWIGFSKLHPTVEGIPSQTFHIICFLKYQCYYTD